MSAAQYSVADIERDALRAGHSAAVAKYLARQCTIDQTRVARGEVRSKPPSVSPLSATRSRQAAAPRASMGTGTRSRLQAVAALYGPAAVALVPRFVASGVSTKRVAEMLAADTGNARHLGESGVARLKFQLDQIGTK